VDDSFFENWTMQLRKGLLAFCILYAIRRGWRYGYDIVKGLRSVHGLMIAEGTIYPLLSRLRREGLVTTAIEDSPDGPPRKCYRLTPRGVAQLRMMDRYWNGITQGVEALRKDAAHA
jgi:PadR family transcriptional regulator PadR